jgi:hypothetical protein
LLILEGENTEQLVSHGDYRKLATMSKWQCQYHFQPYQWQQQSIAGIEQQMEFKSHCGSNILSRHDG